MKRKRPDPPLGWELSREAWDNLTDMEQAKYIRALEGSGRTGVPDVPPPLQHGAVATTAQTELPDAQPLKRQRQVPPAPTQPSQDAAVLTKEELLQRALFGDSGSESDDGGGSALAPVVLADAYIMGHGETAATGEPAVLEPGQVLSFYASEGKDLDFVDALQVLSGENTQVKYTIEAEDDTTVPRLVLTPLTDEETGWAEDCSLEGKTVYLVGRPPLTGEELTLREVLRLVRYQNLHIIACQGAANSVPDVEKSEKSRAVGTMALFIIDSAGDKKNTPSVTLEYIRTKLRPEERAQLMSLPIFEFFVEQLKNPVIGEIAEAAADEIKTDIEKYSSESGKDKAMVDGMLWRALPEPTRNALKDWDQGYWEPFDKLPPVGERSSEDKS
jgi:hypothetical protein